MSTAHNLPAPRRIIASNLPLPASVAASDPQAEPGVEVQAEKITPESIFGGLYYRARVATAKQVPTSNDGSGDIPLDEVPGAGIVLPGGINMYHLDLAPNSDGPLHRTTSTDYLVVLKGQLSLITPGTTPYSVKDGKGTYSETVETICGPGEVIVQRGPMHALSNRTDRWVRVLCVVVASQPNRTSLEGKSADSQAEYKSLEDIFLQ